MADNDVKIKVSLDGADGVEKGLNGIGKSAGDADSKLGTMVSGGLKGAGAALLGFATAAVAAGGALAAGVLNQTAQYEQNIGGIETMFKSSAGKMEQYAADAYRTAGLSANEYMSQATSFSAALLQGLGGDTEKAADVANRAITDMSDNAAKFGSNIGDIQNAYQGFAKQNFTMLDNLKLGYGGTASEMARLVNDAGLMEDGFTATAENINSVSYDQIIASIGKIQDEMGITGTTAREAAQTISGSVDMLKGSFANLLAGLGRSDADVATLAGNVITSLETVLANVTPVIENIGANISTLGPQLGTMMQGLVGAIASAIPAIISAGVALVDGLITGVIGALPSLIGAIVPGIVQLVQTVATLAPQLVTAGAQAVVQLAQGLASAMPMLIPAVIEGIIGMVDALIQALPLLLDAGLQLVMGLVEGVVAAIPVLIAALPQLIDGIVAFITTGVPALLAAAVTLFQGIIQALPQIITQLMAALPTMITAIINAIVGAVPLIIQAGITLLVSLVGALPQIITTIVSALPQIITAVINAVLGAIPMLIQAGIDLFIALIGALPKIITTIVAAIPKIITGVISAVIGAIPQLITAGVQLLVALVKNMPAILGGIVGAIPQIITGIVGAIIGAVPQLAQAGLQLVQGLWNGISDATGWLIGQIGGFVDDVMGAVANFFGIKSPSRRMRDEIGDWLPPGIGQGVEESEDKAIDPITDMNKKIMREADKLKTDIRLDYTLGKDSGVMRVQMLAPEMPQPVPASYTATQTMSFSREFAGAMVEAFRQLEITPEVTATIDSRDMNKMAASVAGAIQNVRAADGKSAALAVQQGVR